MSFSTSPGALVPHIFGGTRFVVHPVTFQWTIDNYEVYLDENTTTEFPCIKSPKFSPPTNPSLQYGLKAYPKGNVEEYNDHLSLYFSLYQSVSDSVRLYVRMSIINDAGEKCETDDMQVKLDAGHGRGWPGFVKKNDILDPANGILPDGKLTILCEVTAYTDQFEFINTLNNDLPNDAMYKAQRQAEFRFSEDFGKLLSKTTTNNSDLILSVSGKEFSVHKLLLSARSPVFSAMFQHDCEEKRNNRVEIEDVDADTFEDLIRFIYTGKVANKRRLTVELLVAADKYGIESLKLLIEQALIETLNIETVAPILVLADMHGAHQLKESCINFITYNSSAVLATDGWKALTETRPELMNPICQSLVSFHAPNKKRKIAAKAANPDDLFDFFSD